MTYLIREMQEEERPRERFKKYGVEALSNEELLSIIMRTGTKSKSVKELSFDLLRTIKINDFAKINYNYLKNIKGIGEVKAITIMASIEFGKRVLSNSYDREHIRDSNDAYFLIKDDLCYEIQEKFLAIFLDTKKNYIDKKIVFVGTVNGSSIVPRDVFREAVKCNASAMIIAHNHPAGSATASSEDIILTKGFVELGKMMGIQVLDHLIICKNNYLSLRKTEPSLF